MESVDNNPVRAGAQLFSDGGQFLHAAKGSNPRCRYQLEQEARFGCLGGDSLLLELGALPARDGNSWPYSGRGIDDLETRDRYIERFLRPRAAYIAREARTNRPALIWMYGAREKYLKYWRTIAGGDFEEDPLGYWFRAEAETVFVVTDHVTHHRKNEYWIALGASMRTRIAAAH